MNQTIEWSGVVTALSSIYHGGGQNIGINSKLRREKFVQPDGTVEDVPLISGNGLRGLLRDRGMFHMCRSLGYGVNEETGEVRGLSLPAFYFLFSGGALVKDGGGKGIDIDRARELRNLIPLVGVFGGAMGNQIMPGKLKVDKMVPICQETKHLLPSPWRDDEVASIWEFLQEEMYTRKDDEKDEHKRLMIDPAIRLLLETAATTKRNAPVQPVTEESGNKQQMMYYVETFAAGTQFYWSLVLDDVTDVEFDAFAVTLAEFARMPYIGAKSNVGLGRVSVKFDQWHTVDARMAHGSQLDTAIGRRYQAHLSEHGATIRELLAGVV